MSMRTNPEITKTPNHPLGSVRKKIAFLMLGAMGSPAVSGCNLHASLNPNPVDEARREAVNGCDDNKLFHIDDAEANVLLARQGGDDITIKEESPKETDVATIEKYTEPKEKVAATLFREPGSPLFGRPQYTRFYDLPGNADPWTSLAHEPSGRITLRMKNNYIAIEFECIGLKSSCFGNEMPDPSVLRENEEAPPPPAQPKAEHSAEEAEEVKKKDEDAKKEENEENVKEEKKTDAVEKPNEAPDHLLVNGEMAFETAPEIKAKLDLLEPALKRGLNSEGGTNWLKAVARDLAQETKYVREVEEMITMIEQNPQYHTLNANNLVIAIQGLLTQKPERIKDIADALRVELPETPSTGNTKGESNHSAETQKRGIQVFNDTNFASEVLGVKNKPVIVTFWGNHCSACERQMPVLETLENSLGDRVVFGKVLIDNNPETIVKYLAPRGSFSIPVSLIFQNGQVVQRLTGFQNQETLARLLRHYVKSD